MTLLNGTSRYRCPSILRSHLLIQGLGFRLSFNLNYASEEIKLCLHSWLATATFLPRLIREFRRHQQVAYSPSSAKCSAAVFSHNTCRCCDGANAVALFSARDGPGPRRDLCLSECHSICQDSRQALQKPWPITDSGENQGTFLTERCTLSVVDLTPQPPQSAPLTSESDYSCRALSPPASEVRSIRTASAPG